jgi:hypothetical protein
MKIGPMPLLRLAYSALYLLALMTVFTLWTQVGGQDHLDLLPWWIKLGLPAAMALTIVRATASAVGGERGWNVNSVRWLGATLLLALLCGLASYYSHMYLEEQDDEGDDQSDTAISQLFDYNSARLDSARRLALSAPTSVTTMRSPS